MNIPGDLQRIQQTPETYVNPTAANKAAPAQSAEAQPAADQTHLSAAANLVSQSASETDVRADKVASVQAAIASGSYHVDSSQVAGKVIDHLLGNGS